MTLTKEQKKQYNNSSDYTELYAFNSNCNHTDVINQIENIRNILLKNQTNLNVQMYIGHCLNELVDNAYVHSQSKFCITQSRKNRAAKSTEFTIVDSGIGIKQSMNEPDIETALRKSINKNVKGFQSQGRGFGLYSSTEVIKKDDNTKSFIEIHSENAIMIIKSGSEPQINNAPYWQGTRVTFCVCDNLKANMNEILIGDFDPDIYENGDLNNFCIDDDLFD